MSERRRSPRQKSFLRGCVYFSKRGPAMDCLIRNISPRGARIMFSETANLPDEVDLYIPQTDRTVRGRVQWRRGGEVGLAFPGPACGSSTPLQSDELARRVSHLEAEVTALWRLLKRLKGQIKSGSDVDVA